MRKRDDFRPIFGHWCTANLGDHLELGRVGVRLEDRLLREQFAQNAPVGRTRETAITRNAQEPKVPVKIGRLNDQT